MGINLFVIPESAKRLSGIYAVVAVLRHKPRIKACAFSGVTIIIKG